ncbi:MAG: hypothetical protein KC418_13630 [Anaerolineales bacterium]|nr:hypothetical protein [Anaerolineales bacterium]MCB8953814.1 hypothetical protein [Ardenticatenales bacterium]
MDRTVPSRANEEINLYIRTYYSLLRSSHEVQIRTLIEAHTRMNSALHVDADETTPDMAAFIYSILRLPGCILSDADRVVMGQSADLFVRHGYTNIRTWQRVDQPARRRRVHYDGKRTLAVYITSRSDIDDIIPTLTAYQIERDKLHWQLSDTGVRNLLQARLETGLNDDDLKQLAKKTQVSEDDWDRLSRIWKKDAARNLLAIAQKRQKIAVRLLGSSLADYNRATRRWWSNVEETMKHISFHDRPVYFVSSNTHSLANVISGYARLQRDELVSFIQANGDGEMQREYADIIQRNVPSNLENFFYYALKKYEGAHPETVSRRIEQEENAGITRILSQEAYDIEVQVVDMSRIKPDLMDPRLRFPGMEHLIDSDALIVNIDFPLGMAAYEILSEISSNVDQVRGVYIMGKAATLNGRIGDVMLPKVIHDEQSLNTFLIENCFAAEDVAPYLVYGTVLDNQKAISVRGTFLQNEQYMAIFYQEGYTILEMEAGPYLSSVYEMVRPQRYPQNELIDLHEAPFPIGILHYASDTPFSKGKNLGSQNLSYFGMDPTYATMIAIVRAIFREEVRRLSSEKILNHFLDRHRA